MSVVLDFGLWARIERDEMRLAARELGVGVELHYLDVAPDELWRRIEARNAEPPWEGHPIRHADLDGWLRVFQAPDGAELALFDVASRLELDVPRRPGSRVIRHAWKGAPVRRNRVPVLQCSG